MGKIITVVSEETQQKEKKQEVQNPFESSESFIKRFSGTPKFGDFMFTKTGILSLCLSEEQKKLVLDNMLKINQELDKAQSSGIKLHDLLQIQERQLNQFIETFFLSFEIFNNNNEVLSLLLSKEELKKVNEENINDYVKELKSIFLRQIIQGLFTRKHLNFSGVPKLFFVPENFTKKNIPTSVSTL